MTGSYVLTPLGSAAIGVRHIDAKGKPPKPEPWLIEQCKSDPMAAAEEIASLMQLRALDLQELELLRAQVAMKVPERRPHRRKATP